MKKRGILVVVIAILAAGAWWGFQWWRSYSATVWKYLPENSFFVIQSTHLQDTTYQIHRGDIDIRQLPLINLAAQQIDVLRNISVNENELNKFYKGRNITYALQKTPTDQFVFLIFVPLQAFDNLSWLENPASAQAHITSHLHNGQKIFDISSSKSEPLGSYTIYQNMLVLCSAGELLEDWLRFAQSPLSATNNSRFENVSPNQSEFCLFIDSSLLSDALKHDVNAKDDAGLIYFLSMLPGIESMSFYPLLSGQHFTLVSQGKKIKTEGYVDMLNNQKGVPFKSGSYIPNNMAVTYRLAFENKSAFVRELKKNIEGITPDTINKMRQELTTTIGINRLDSFYTFLDKELLMIQLEPNNVLTKGQVVLQQLQITNHNLESFVSRLSILFNKGKEAPFVPFQGSYIYTLDWPELPASLFGGLFKGFPKCHIAFRKNYILYANDQQVLKDYLIDLEYKQTWIYSGHYEAFLKNEMRPSTFMMLLNVRKSKEYVGAGYLNFLLNKLNYDLTEKIQFEYLLFQSAYKSSRAYSSLTFAKISKTANAKALNKLFSQQEIAIEKPISGPFSVKNNPNGIEKILIVNAANKLVNPYLEVKKQELANIDGPIVGDIHSVDFLSVDRFQYVFATANGLYVVDEDDEQRYMTLPIVRLPNGRKIRSFQRLESGIEGSFRFLVVDETGYIYLWNSPNTPPQLLNASRPFTELLLPISEIEYNSKRHFLFSQAEGKIGLISESGVIPAPYKIDLKTRISAPFFGIYSPENNSNKIVGSSKYGELFDIELNGNIKSKTQLFRTGPTCFFGAKADDTNRDWLLVRESESHFAILDKKGKELFVAKGLLPQQNNVQYHFFGADVKFLSIKSGKYTTLYDLKGTQMGDKPIPSDVPIRVTYVAAYNKLLIYSYANGKMLTWSMKVR